MSYSIQTNSDLGVANFAFSKQYFNTQQITSKLYKDLDTNRKLSYDTTFVYQLKSKLEVIKTQMHVQDCVKCELVVLQLKSSTLNIYKSVVNFEAFINKKVLKLTTTEKKMLKDLQKLKQDTAVINMYLEV